MNFFALHKQTLLYLFLPYAKTVAQCFIFILTSLNVSAQGISNSFKLKTNNAKTSGYREQSIGIQEGLNSFDILALFQDSDGFIWVGTKTGCSRFDGHTFQNFVTSNDASIGQIQSIEEDQSEILWIGGNQGLLFFQNGEFHTTSLNKYVIQDLHFGKNNELWVVGLGFVPFTLSSSDLEHLKIGKSININPIVSPSEWEEKIGSLRTWAVDTDNKGSAWFGLDNRHASYDGKQLQVNWSKPSVIHKYSMIKAFDQDSVFWGSEATSIIFQKNNQFSSFGDSNTYIAHATDSCTYFLSGRSLLKLCDGQWQTLHTLDTYSNIYPKKMILDQEGNFWIGAEGNLLKISPSHFRNWSISDFPLLEANHSIVALPSNELLIGSISGKVLKKVNNTFQKHTTLSVLNSSMVKAISFHDDGSIWYATTMNGIVVDQNGRQDIFDQKKGLGDNGQLFFYKSKKGTFWSGGDGGISNIHRSASGDLSFENYTIDFQNSEMPIFNNIFESPDGTIWAVGEQGLFTLNNNTLVSWALPPPINSAINITDAIIDDQNHLWISTQGQGLLQCQFNSKNEPVLSKQWSETNGLLSNIILDIHLDQQNRIWTVSQKGLCLLDFKSDQIKPQCFDERDGWPGTPTSIAKLYETQDSLLWILQSTGLSRLSLYNLPVNHVKPKSFIVKVELFDGKEDIFQYANNQSKINNLPQQLVLPSNKNFLRFHFTSNSHTQPSKNKFRYKLEGLDPGWNEVSNKLDVMYPGLQSGEYCFKVVAANNDGIWGEESATYSFTILPPWHKTWWAYTLWGLLLLSIFYAWFRIQTTRRNEKEEAFRLKELDSFKTRFYSNITHEFRTPLTVIEGMANELKNHPKLEPERKINLIKKNSRNLLTLVNQMLDLSKLKAGKVSIELKQDNIIACLKYLVESHESYAKMQNIDLQFYAEEQKILMDFDAKKLEQILVNLLSNAIKFTPEHGKILVVAKKTTIAKTHTLTIRVKDSGIGISKENLPHIFDRFHQVNPIHNNQGSGIGLAMVKELIGIMNGTINVESAPQEGSTFSITLPIQNKAPFAKEFNQATFNTLPITEKLKEKNPVLDQNGLPILLIIEDNIDVTYYLKTCLNGLYQTLSVNNGKAGVEKALEILPDIIISDVMMPEMDGFEVCKILKGEERSSHIPIILLTAKATTEDKLEGLTQGADAYLTKPFEKAELLIRLDKLMAIRKTLQNKYSKALISSDTDNIVLESKEDSFIQKVEKIILINIEDEDFSSNELGRALHLSRSQVHRKLKALTGMSTSIYIRHIRLQKAKILLTSSELSISEIAYKVGFKSPTYFSQVFKEAFGESPNATRKQT